MSYRNFVFITDIHFHNFTEFAKPDSKYVSDRFKAQLDALQDAFDLAKAKKAILIIGGDVFHNRGSINTRIFNLVFAKFLENSTVEVYILRGNHDSTTNSLHTSSSIEPLGALPNVLVITEPTKMLIGDVGFLFVPYGDETDEMKEAINSYESDHETNILVGHFGVEGASQGKGSHRLGGAFGIADLRPDTFDYILLGHYHKRQTLGDNPKHIYGGNLMQVNFGDEGQKKGAHVINPDKGTIDFVPFDTKMFSTINGASVPPNFNELVENNYVRFIGTKEQVKAIGNVEDEEEIMKNVRVELEKDYHQEARMGLDATMSPIDITKTFAEQKYPNAVNKALECLSQVM